MYTYLPGGVFKYPEFGVVLSWTEQVKQLLIVKLQEGYPHGVLLNTLEGQQITSMLDLL